MRKKIQVEVYNEKNERKKEGLKLYSGQASGKRECG